MKVAVVPNLTKKEAKACTDEVLAILEQSGCSTILKTDLFDQNGVYRESRDERLGSCDLILAVGGRRDHHPHGQVRRFVRQAHPGGERREAGLYRRAGAG